MCTLPLLAGENVGHAFVVPTVASSVDGVVVRVGTDYGRASADLFTTRGGRLVRAEGYLPHPERFAALGMNLAELLGPTAGRRSA
jgi:pilus assembly protein CpaF